MVVSVKPNMDMASGHTESYARCVALTGTDFVLKRSGRKEGERSCFSVARYI